MWVPILIFGGTCVIYTAMVRANWIRSFITRKEIVFIELCVNNLNLLNLKRAELNNLNFYPLEVVSRYRDPQLQVSENYPYLFIVRSNI